ncbi:MAG: hypothetical protein KDB14_03965 [Planctomycetales bacterium]|nr:hypothetical protein [Planctomycetales bacterium]
MRGSGGTEGGAGQFWAGFGLSVLALYFFFDSVNATTDAHGVFGGMLRRGGGGMWDTTSTGLLFVPFFLGVMALFYDASQKWAWVLMWVGLAVIVIEILSRIRFHMNVKTTFLLGVIVMFAAGAGLMLRSYRDFADEGVADEGVADEKPQGPHGKPRGTGGPGRSDDPPTS